MEQARSTEQSSEQLTSRVLDMHGIEDLRARQKDEYDSCYTPGEGVSDSEAMNSKMAELVKEYMRDNNVDETHPYWDSLYQNLRAWSYDNISNVTWDYGKWDNPSSSDRSIIPDTDGQSQVDNVRSMLVSNTEPNDMSSSSAPEPVASETSDSSGSENGSAEPDMEQMYDEAMEINGKYDGLQLSREKWATVSAKRQGRAVGKGSKDYDAIHDEYQTNLREFGIISLSDKIQDDDDDTTKNVKVIEYLFKEQVRLRELTTKKLNDTKVGKFVAFMNRGNLATRVAKGVGLGVAVGVTGGFFLGAVGAAGAGAAAVGASRFVKGYASNDRDRGMQSAQESFIDENGNNYVEFINDEAPTLEKKLTAAANVYNDDFEADTKKEQVKRRKALAWGAISVAAGASIGYSITAASDKSGVLIDGIKDWYNGPDVKDLTPTPDTDGAIDNSGGDGAPEQKTIDGDTLTRGELFTGFHGTRELTEVGRQQMFEALDGYTVKSGDSVWNLAEQTLHDQGIKHPTVFEVDTVKDDMLHELRSNNQVDARGWLSVGTELSLKP
jgi:hypothetical protein